MLLKVSTARNLMLKMYLSSDHVSAATGKTLTVTLSKDGGAFAAAGATVTEISSGWYKLALTTTDTNTNGTLVIRATAASCDDSEVVYQVVAFDPTDATALGLSRIDAAISSRSTYAGADTSGTTTLLTRIGGNLTITGGKVDVNDKTGFSLSSAGVQAIWDALTSALSTASSIGKLLVDNINATISSRSTYSGGAVASVTAAVTVGTNNDKTGYALTSGERDSIASNIFKFDLSTITGEAARSLLNAVRFLRNKVSISSGTMTVTKEDDTTSAWTATLTTDNTAEPVVTVDPT